MDSAPNSPGSWIASSGWRQSGSQTVEDVRGQLRLPSSFRSLVHTAKTNVAFRFSGRLAVSSAPATAFAASSRPRAGIRLSTGHYDKFSSDPRRGQPKRARSSGLKPNIEKYPRTILLSRSLILSSSTARRRATRPHIISNAGPSTSVSWRVRSIVGARSCQTASASALMSGGFGAIGLGLGSPSGNGRLPGLPSRRLMCVGFGRRPLIRHSTPFCNFAATRARPRITRNAIPSALRPTPGAMPYSWPVWETSRSGDSPPCVWGPQPMSPVVAPPRARGHV